LASLLLTRRSAILDEVLAQAYGVGIWPRKCIKHRLHLVLSIVFGCWFYTCRSIHLRSGIDLGRNLGASLSAVDSSIPSHETKISQLNRSNTGQKICMRGASHWPNPRSRCPKSHISHCVWLLRDMLYEVGHGCIHSMSTGCFGAGNSNRQFAPTGNFELRWE
jgi:hypothetical protein